MICCDHVLMGDFLLFVLNLTRICYVRSRLRDGPVNWESANTEIKRGESGESRGCRESLSLPFSFFPPRLLFAWLFLSRLPHYLSNWNRLLPKLVCEPGVDIKVTGKYSYVLYAVTLTTQKSLLGASLSLSHTLIDPPSKGSNLILIFPRSIPVIFVWESLRVCVPLSFHSTYRLKHLWKLSFIKIYRKTSN